MKKLFPNLEKKHYWLLAGWLLLNIMQSVFTNLHADEAYYWMYSKNLAWGYFDHPPMVAFLIYLGDSLFHAELGVRLIFILLSTITMAMIINELDEKEDLFFLGLFVLSFPLINTHIAGFMAIPDTPLVFLSLLFYLSYKKFATAPTLKLSFLLAFVAAAMLYSKYHAFLVFGFVVLSNLKLLRNKYFWLTIVVATLLLTPHFYWQITNDFPSFKYHLVGRSKPIRFWTVHNNLTSQLLVAGPLTSLIVFYALTRFKINKDLYRRAMIFSILGFYIFFFIMSFKNRIEAHYTSVITPLLMFATYPLISEKPGLKKWFKRLALPVVIVFLLFRFYLAADFLPNVGQIKIAFYKHREASTQIKQMADGKQVASFNNFAFPGTYEFYTGDKVMHLATPSYRFCQFDLWNEEESSIGNSLFVIIPDRMDNTNLITLTNGRKVKTQIIPEFEWLKQVAISPVGGNIVNDSLSLKIEVANLSGRIIPFNHTSAPSIGFMVNRIEVSDKPLFDITGKEQLDVGEKIELRYNVPILKDEKQSLVVFLQTSDRNRGKMFEVNFDEYKK